MKIKLAYALGLIEQKAKKELTLIKNIRNVFAHAAIPTSLHAYPVNAHTHYMLMI